MPSSLELQAQAERERRRRRALAPRVPLTFREFVSRVNPRFVWYRYAEVAADVIERVVSGEIARLMVMAPPRHGKALAEDTPIPTPSGWKAIKDLVIGDEVFAGDGSVTKVTATAWWADRPVYRVTTDDGHSVIADAAHEWLVRLCRKQKSWSRRETRFLAQRTSPRNPLIPTSGPMQCPAKSLPIPPYTLGAWLGDGTSGSGAITIGDADRDWMVEQLWLDGFKTRTQPSSRLAIGVLGLQKKLRESGLLRNKHIPEAYFRASVSQREALLQGLIDTDGYVAEDGQVEFCNTNEQLSRQVLELVNGLGIKASLIEGRSTLYGKDCGPKFRVMFYFSRAARMERKARRCKDGVRSPGRFLAFQDAGRANTACIEIEHPSHLFLVGKACIVTSNSELFSRLLPAYFVYRNPDKFAAIASYGARLAEGFNRHARRHYFATCGIDRTETTAVEHWETGKGGGAWAVGVGGGSTGKGFHLGVIDDPVKDDQDAQSEVIRARTTDWYESVWSTRLAPGAVQVVVMTRWHEQDLVGYLLDKERGESPECWHVVNMQAVYDPANMIELPKSCTLEPDWREAGEALCPERYPLPVLRAVEAKTPRVFSSLYQQHPRPRDGSLFKWAHFADKFLDAIPAGMKWIAYWDTAGTEGDGDHTAGALVGHDSRSGRFHIAEVVRGQWGPSRKDLEIRATCERWKKLVGLSQVWLETEAGIGGKDRTKATIAALVGFRVQTEHPTGSKVVRAEVWAAQQEAGNVTMSRGDWNHGFIERSTAFPYSNVDDEQDAVSGAFAKIGSVGRGFVYVAPEDQAAYEREIASMRQSA